MPSNTILIVDDTPNNIRLLFDVLNQAGFDISVVKSGETALEKLPDIQPDLILLDVMMPGIDGFETFRRIKVNPENQDIPIIFMTALSDPEHKVAGLQMGAVDYITKPIQVEEVLARVNTHLRLRNIQQQLLQEVSDRKIAEINLKQTLVSLQQMQMQLIQSEKMSALGGLVAGVAHEINNPIGFLNGSINNGKGMNEDVKSHIFDHLFTTKAVGKGTGLGLAIAHQIVTEKHNGCLEVHSKIGQGSEFIITLPVKTNM